MLVFSWWRCAREDMRGVSGPGFMFCCWANVEWMVANLRCNLSTYKPLMQLYRKSDAIPSLCGHRGIAETTKTAKDMP